MKYFIIFALTVFFHYIAHSQEDFIEVGLYRQAPLFLNDQINSVTIVGNKATTIEPLMQILEKRINLLGLETKLEVKLESINNQSIVLTNKGDIKEFNAFLPVLLTNPTIEIKIAKPIQHITAADQEKSNVTCQYFIRNAWNRKYYCEYMIFNDITITNHDIMTIENEDGMGIIKLSENGYKKLQQIVKQMDLGKDRLAVMLNGQILMAPVIHQNPDSNILLIPLDSPLTKAMIIAQVFTKKLPEPYYFKDNSEKDFEADDS